MPGHPGREKPLNSAQTPIATDRPHAWGASMTASVFASPASLPGTYRAGFDSLPKAAFYAARGMRRFFPGESFAAGRPNLAAGDPGDSQNRRNPSPRGASPWMRVSIPRLDCWTAAKGARPGLPPCKFSLSEEKYLPRATCGEENGRGRIHGTLPHRAPARPANAKTALIKEIRGNPCFLRQPRWQSAGACISVGFLAFQAFPLRVDLANILRGL